MARKIPGKEEFHGFVAWFEAELAASSITTRLNTSAKPDMLADFDEVIIATGVRPRDPGIEGQERALSYIDVLAGEAEVGTSVAIIGAGGIGFDVATYLAESDGSRTMNLDQWLQFWGVTDPEIQRGGLAEGGPRPDPAARQITLLQRKSTRPGKGLGKTTGWIHRAGLQLQGVTMRGGVNYERIAKDGLHLSSGEAHDNPEVLAVDTVVLCSGQEPERTLADALADIGTSAHVIGGADVAAELDAKRAIDQGTRLAASL